MKRGEKLPEKVMGTFPGMTPLEGIEARFRARARECRQAAIDVRREGTSDAGSYWACKAETFTAAAEMVRHVRAKEIKP